MKNFNLPFIFMCLLLLGLGSLGLQKLDAQNSKNKYYQPVKKAYYLGFSIQAQTNFPVGITRYTGPEKLAKGYFDKIRKPYYVFIMRHPKPFDAYGIYVTPKMKRPKWAGKNRRRRGSHSRSRILSNNQLQVDTVLYLTPWGTPKEDKMGFHKWRFQYDKAGNVTQIRTFDKMGNPKAGPKGIATTYFKYDKAGNEILRGFLGSSGQPHPYLDKLSAFTVRKKFYRRWSCFNMDEYKKLRKDFPHIFPIFKSRKLLFKRGASFCIDFVRINSQDRKNMGKTAYDVLKDKLEPVTPDSKLVAERYFIRKLSDDRSGYRQWEVLPGSGPEGSAMVLYEYNPDGELYLIRFYNGKRIPALNRKGYAALEISKDDVGRTFLQPYNLSGYPIPLKGTKQKNNGTNKTITRSDQSGKSRYGFPN